MLSYPGLFKGSAFKACTSIIGRHSSSAFLKILSPILAKLNMSLAILWPFIPPTISGAICGKSLAYCLLRSSEKIFGPMAPLKGTLFPKSITIGLYIPILLSRTTLSGFKSLCKNPTSCTQAKASAVLTRILFQVILSGISFFVSALEM